MEILFCFCHSEHSEESLEKVHFRNRSFDKVRMTAVEDKKIETKSGTVFTNGKLALIFENIHNKVRKGNIT